MNKIRARVALFATALLAVGGSVTVLTASPASAHGVMILPGARTYMCYEDGLSTNGSLNPTNPACAAAVAQTGTTPLYNWFAVLRSDAGGKTVGYIPDGQICSGGTGGPYNFTSYNAARDDWPVTHLTSGANFGFRYSNWAAHPGTFFLSVTPSDWDPTQPLKWSDLTDFMSVTNPTANGPVGSINGRYEWTGQLPARTGRALILARWVRSDSNENFFSCSDVVFDGGKGEVTGATIHDSGGIADGTGGGGTTTTTTTTAGGGGGTTTTTTRPTTTTTTTRPTTTTTSQGGGGGSGCLVTYTTNQWSGGFTADVKVTSTTALSNWTVKWTYPGDSKIGSAWNATVTQSGNAVTATNMGYNGTIPAGGSASFGFQGSWSNSNAAPNDFSVNGVACNGPGGGGQTTTTTTTTGQAATTTTSRTTTTTTSRATTTTTTTGGGGGGSALNDGFETQSAGTVGGGWTLHPQKTCDSGADGSGQATSTATIDNTTAHSGSNSLKVTGLSQFCQHLLAKAPVNMAAVGSTAYVRVWFKHQNPFSGNHVSFMAMTDANDGGQDIRVGIQKGGGANPVLMWNRQTSDATIPQMSPAGNALSVQIPANTWTCLEYSISTSGNAQTWVNGNGVRGLTVDGIPTADIDSGWGSWHPAITDLRLGWEPYGNDSDTFWYDDVAVSNSRIGC